MIEHGNGNKKRASDRFDQGNKLSIEARQAKTVLRVVKGEMV